MVSGVRARALERRSVAIRTDRWRAALAMHAVARARPRARPARVSLRINGPALACALVRGGPPLTAQAGTRLCIQCNIGGVAAASAHAYRTDFIADRAGSILASTHRVNSGERPSARRWVAR